MSIVNELGLPQLKLRDAFPPYKPLPEDIEGKKRILDKISKILIKENAAELQEFGFIDGDKAYAKSTDKTIAGYKKLIEPITPTPYCGRKIFIGAPRVKDNELLFCFGPNKNDTYSVFMDLFLFGNKGRLEKEDERVLTDSSNVKMWIKQDQKEMLDTIISSLGDKAKDGFPMDKLLFGFLCPSDIKKDEYDGKVSIFLNVDDIVWLVAGTK